MLITAEQTLGNQSSHHDGHLQFKYYVPIYEQNL